MFACGGITESDGVFPFSEPVLVTYIDLDRLIATTKFTDAEKYTLDHIMMGYTFLDLERLTGKSRRTFSKLFERACQAIKETNDKRWADVYSKKVLSP